MKAVVKMVTGDTYTIEGGPVRDLHKYFTAKEGAFNSLPLGWVSNNLSAINFKHVIHVDFINNEQEVEN